MENISVIIPVYNLEKYVKRSVESVLRQTMKELDIICVDDCSTDKSGEILDSYQAIDPRVKVIHNKSNLGLAQARKIGVQKAQGKYIMFLDGDDFYEKNACEVVYHEMQKESIDILHFGVNIINAGNASDYEYNSMLHFMKPYIGILKNDEIMKKCFEDELYNHNMSDKAFKADLCKQIFRKIDVKGCYMGEDMLLYFLISLYAKVYKGIENKVYNYNFAIGVSKPGKLTLEDLDKRCTAAKAIQTLEHFLKNEKIYTQYANIFKKIEKRLLADNFEAWYYRLESDKYTKGHQIFENHWGKDRVIQGLLYDIESKQYDINTKQHIIEQLRSDYLRVKENNEKKDRLIELENEHIIQIQKKTKRTRK